MAFFKPIYKKMSKKWHPQAVSVGKPIEMAELCKQIALISTVSSADSKATLEALGLVLGSSMNTGRTVHVEGLGTFYYTCISNGKGVDSAEKVNANQISGTRVRFIPESRLFKKSAPLHNDDAVGRFCIYKKLYLGLSYP